MIRCFLNDKEFDEVVIRERVKFLIKDAKLQSVFVVGENINIKLFELIKKVLNSNGIFMSNVHISEEAGCIVAVDDYNTFSKTIIEKRMSDKEIEDLRIANKESENLKMSDEESKITEKVIEKPKMSVIESKPKQNLFNMLFKRPYNSWTNYGLDQTKFPININASKNMEILKSAESNELVLNNPVYPSLFNKFWNSEHDSLYRNYFFDKR